MLLRLPSFSAWTPEQVARRFWGPRIHPVERCDGGSPRPSAPYTVVRPISLGQLMQFCLKDPEPEIRVIGFGKAFFSTPRCPKLPKESLKVGDLWQEIPFNDWKQVDSQSDLWSLACTIFQILGGSGLFYTWIGEGDPQGVLGKLAAALDGADIPLDSLTLTLQETETEQVLGAMKEKIAKLYRSLLRRGKDVRLQALLQLLVNILKCNELDRITEWRLTNGLPCW
jgi:serine/threonine protein kinase